MIGAGWAGLAAAVEAVQAGGQVSVFEMAHAPGGRARTVSGDDLVLDNGQHILIGAYTQTLRMMRTVGVDPNVLCLRTPLRMAGPDGGGLVLGSGSPVLAFAVAVLRRGGWSVGQRLSLLSTTTGWALRGFRCDPSLTVQALSARLPSRVRNELIDPLCVAALNTPSPQASGSVFLRVLRDALFSGHGSADLLLPRARLSALFPDPAVAWLARHGTKVHGGHRIMSIERDGHAWRVEGNAFDAVILGCSAAEAARLARPYAEDWAAQAAQLTYEPIATVYARAAQARLPHPMMALPSDNATRPAQFVFDHGQLGGDAGLLAFVVSGAAPWVERGTEAIFEATLRQAHEQLAPWLRQGTEAVRCIIEKRATFRCTPQLIRPAGVVAAGLYAAGDYVDGPYPATLEGAVRSGVAAARAV